MAHAMNDEVDVGPLVDLHLEFEKSLTEEEKVKRSTHRESVANDPKLKEKAMEKFEEAFKRADLNGDNLLDRAEFGTFMVLLKHNAD